MHPDIPVEWDDNMGTLMYDILIKYNFGQSNLWVKTTTSSSQTGTVDMFTFTGQPRKVYRNLERGFKYCFLGARMFPSGWQDEFRCILPLGDFYDVDYVIPTFEITRNPSDSHPTPYANVPEIGPWDNWKQARRLALRIDHIKDGKVIGQYQHSHDHTFPYTKYGLGSEHTNFLAGAWSRVMAWIAALTNVKWANRSWFRHWAIQPYEVIVEEITPCFASQQMVISQSGPREIQEPPKRIHVENNMRMMYELYAREHPEMSIGAWSRKLLPSGRETCDACHMAMSNPAAMHCPLTCLDCSPQQVNLPNSRKTVWACDFCVSVGRVCTFTPERYLDQHFDDFKSLGYARVLGGHRQLSDSEKRTARLLLNGACIPEYRKEVNPVTPEHVYDKEDIDYDGDTEEDGMYRGWR
ncbi:hypothetical protein CGCSCA4_v008759 [Colletotrichum siamense]|uniref:Uncharacterized protein n=1 Tax=Colletotrichum siamense TaxID=690259 RepID=A0A9P5K3M3_COLSI|nr:hypothetical protein CGCSCA4_v008759 [Colletotrichum siamense]KAF4858449.1 hypothetical protein CGCSCA2_v007340 [Colletotrichum siamense]